MSAPLKVSCVVVAGGEICCSPWSRFTATTTLVVLYSDVLSAIELKHLLSVHVFSAVAYMDSLCSAGMLDLRLSKKLRSSRCDN